MNLGLNSALLEKLAEGMITLDKNGKLVDFNRAARPWLRHWQGCASELEVLTKKIALGTVQAPVDIGWMLPSCTGNAEFYLCQNGSQGFAILIAVRLPVQGPQLVQQDSFSSLLGEDFRHELSDLRQQLDQATTQSPDSRDALRKQSLRLSRLLVAMEQLCELNQPDAFSRGDRIGLHEIVRAVVADLPSRRSDFSINEMLSGEADRQGMVFGHGAWLKVAIKALLEGIGECAPTDCQMEIRIRQNGGFVVVTCNFSRFFGRRPSLVKSGDAPAATLRTAADLRLAISRRIVALHGGQLKIATPEPATEGVESGGIESFTLILPTGAPVQGRDPAGCAGCIFPKQAEMYAQDLALLLPSRPAGATISNEELLCLAHITTGSRHFQHLHPVPR